MKHDGKMIPEPIIAAHSTKWWEKPEYERHGDSMTIQRARKIQQEVAEATQRAYTGLKIQNPDVTRAKHITDWSKRTDTQRRHLGERLATLREQAKRELSTLNQTMLEEAGIARDSAHGTEIREYVRSLPERKRAQFIEQAVHDGDAQTLAAILNGPGYLAGLDGQKQANLREMYIRRNLPELVERRETVEQALKVATDAYVRMTDYIVDITPSDELLDAEQQRQRFKAAARGVEPDSGAA